MCNILGGGGHVSTRRKLEAVRKAKFEGCDTSPSQGVGKSCKKGG